MAHRVVLTDPHQHTFSDDLLGMLESAGGKLECRRCSTDDEVVDLCRDADAVLNSSARIGREATEQTDTDS
jgi:hypothetical protein